MDDWFYDEGEAREEVEAKVGIKYPFLISSPNENGISSPNEKGISGFSFGQQKSHFHDSEPRWQMTAPRRITVLTQQR